LHPGVTDKGNYSMFEVTRPLVAPSNGMPPYIPEPRPYHPLAPPVRVIIFLYYNTAYINIRRRPQG